MFLPKKLLKKAFEIDLNWRMAGSMIEVFAIHILTAWIVAGARGRSSCFSLGHMDVSLIFCSTSDSFLSILPGSHSGNVSFYCSTLHWNMELSTAVDA